MDTLTVVQVKFISTPELIQEIENHLRSQPESATVQSVKPVADVTSYQFGLTELAEIVTVVQGAYLAGQLAAKLHQLLQERRASNRRIVIQTPLGRSEFLASEALTEEQIRAIVTQLAKAHK
jgi:hypothetical protein